MSETTPQLQPIAPNKLALRPHHDLNDRWMLLAAGDYAAGEWNAMTISWGAFGTIWGLPYAQVNVRPQRYTFEFMEAHESFTLCAFPARFRTALEIMGSRSGRQGDKAAAAGLTPLAAKAVAAPVFAEAELVLECRKLYSQPMTLDGMLDARARNCYKQSDLHTIYYGEIVEARGVAAYVAG